LRVSSSSNVVDYSIPGNTIAGSLMNQLLTIRGIALIGVVAHELVVVHHQEGLPDRSFTIVGNGLSSSSNVGDVLPGLAAVGRSIEVDLGLAEIGGILFPARRIVPLARLPMAWGRTYRKGW
jgi:hypothetical protein